MCEMSASQFWSALFLCCLEKSVVLQIKTQISIIMSNFCEYCGMPLKEGSKFCTGCGHPVAEKPQPSQPSQQSQQLQQGYPYGQQPCAQQPPRQGYAYGGATPQPPKKKNGLMYVLIGLVAIAAMAVSAVIVFPSLNPLRQKDDKKEVAEASQENPNGTTQLNQELPQTEDIFSSEWFGQPPWPLVLQQIPFFFLHALTWVWP